MYAKNTRTACIAQVTFRTPLYDHTFFSRISISRSQILRHVSTDSSRYYEAVDGLPVQPGLSTPSLSANESVAASSSPLASVLRCANYPPMKKLQALGRCIGVLGCHRLSLRGRCIDFIQFKPICVSDRLRFSQ